MGRPQRDIGRVSVVTAATALPVSVDSDVKPHLRIDHDVEDTGLEADVLAAAGQLATPSGWLGRSLMPQRLKLTLDAPPARVIYLPGPPVTAVKTIKVRESDDTITTIYDADAPTDTIGLITDLDAEPALIWPDDDIGWPSDIKYGPDSMQIEYLAGYADADALPREIRMWILQRVAELYRDRDASILGVASNHFDHFDRLLDNLRVRA